MFGEHHYLELEFPKLKDRIHNLLSQDSHFAQLYKEYHAIDDEVWRIEEQIETPSDYYTENLKKKRVFLKDKLYAILVNNGSGRL